MIINFTTPFSQRNGGDSLLVVVTGGSRGIGAAIASRFENVVSLSRTKSECPWIACDVRDFTSVHDAFGKLFTEYGIPDALVNCAGIVQPRPFLETHHREFWDQVLTNLYGPFLVMKEFVSLYKLTLSDPPDPQRLGVIVNIGSTTGTRPSPNLSAYAASKAGLHVLSESVREELRPWCEVYTLVLARTSTNLRKQIAPDEDPTKLLQPQEIADFVHYLITKKPLVHGPVMMCRRTR